MAHRRYVDDIPLDIKKQRLQEIVAVQYELSLTSNQQDVGKEFEVLIEGDSKRDEQDWMGRTSQNKVVVFPKSKAGLKAGDYVRIKIDQCTKATLMGRLVE